MRYEKRVNLRLVNDDAKHFEAMMENIKRRERGRVYESDVIKEFMGLLPVKLVTEEDRRILVHGTAAPMVLPDQLPKLGRLGRRDR